MKFEFPQQLFGTYCTRIHPCCIQFKDTNCKLFTTFENLLQNHFRKTTSWEAV